MEIPSQVGAAGSSDRKEPGLLVGSAVTLTFPGAFHTLSVPLFFAHRTFETEKLDLFTATAFRERGNPVQPIAFVSVYK